MYFLLFVKCIFNYIFYPVVFLFDSKVFKNIRVLNNRTNLGNKYLVNKYIIIINNKKLYVTWFTKKNGISCGIKLKIQK
jgi:hypothetical protein